MYKIETAKTSDAQEILDIYAPYIADTAITFDCDIPTAEEYAKRIASITQTYPWIVCKEKDRIIGFAYAATHNVRAAFRWSVNCSVYIHPEYHGKGIASNLYSILFEILKAQGFYNAYAGITVPNEKSMRLHEKFEFHSAGLYKNVGYKLGHWHDVAWLEKQLMPITGNPGEPKLPGEISMDKIINKLNKL